MTFGKIKSALLVMLLAAFAAPTAFAGGGSTYYAQLTVNLGGGSTGRGLVYASNSETEATGSYGTVASTAGNGTGTQGGNVSVYAYAYPTFGNKFTRWTNATTTRPESGTAASTPRHTYTLEASRNDGQNNALQYYAYAVFDDAPDRIVDVNLCVGDTAQFYFYNSANNTWRSRVNNTFITSTGEVNGTLAGVIVSSVGNTQKYNVKVTAKTASATATDQLTVMDVDGNVYHYRIHVAASRELAGGDTGATSTCVSFASKAWTASSGAAAVASVTPTSAGAATSLTVAFGTGNAGSATVTVRNYQDGTTTGPLGAEYKLAVTVTKPTVDLGTGAVVFAGEDGAIPANLFGASAWSLASSAATGVVTLPATAGAAGTDIRVHGVAPGEALVTFETPTARYTARVQVVEKPAQMGIPVYMSAKASAEIALVNTSAQGDPLTIVASGATEAIGADFAEGQAGGGRFVLRLTAAAAAAVGETATFLVKAGDAEVAQLVCEVVETTRHEAGSLVQNVLPGVAETPWVCRSSDPAVATLQALHSGRAYTAEAHFLKDGEVEFQATNVSYRAGCFFLRKTVFTSHVTDVDLTAGASTNVAVTALSANFGGAWHSCCGVAGLVDVALVPDPSDPRRVTVQIAALSAVTGAVNVVVENDYHRETISVYVGEDDGRAKVHVTGTIPLVVGMTRSLPEEATTKEWTARSMTPGLVTVTASGAAGAPANITAVALSVPGPDGTPVSQATVVVESDEAVYLYTVTPVKPEKDIDMGVIKIGETHVVELAPGTFAGTVQSVAVTDGNATLDCVHDAANHRVTVTGRDEGETTIVVTTDVAVYNVHVRVRADHIDKQIELVFGEEGSTHTYSYTFDRLVDISADSVGDFNVTTNGDGSILYAQKGGRFTVRRDGNTVTFVPGTIEDLDYMSNTISFLGQVDGLPHVTEIHYLVKVVGVADDEHVLERPGSEGYITYRGTDDVHVDPATGDLILVFTNANTDAMFTVPAPYNVKMDILAVGGGGAGGSTVRYGQGGGGGGAGGFTYVQNRVLTAGTFGVVVGTGAPGSDDMLHLGAGMQGLNGNPSALTNAFGYAFASAEGGGGGGALSFTPDSINGMEGGSGGGAAWNNRLAGRAGGAVSGQGFSGGVPEMQGAGGGGGGAGGAGGTTGAAGAGGAGRTSDISGTEVTYAVGGAGGHNDRQQAGAPGNGPGFGGEGGSGAAGGSGADGIVVVRIKSIYRNIKVPIPGTEDIFKTQPDGTTVQMQVDMVTPRFVWTNGEVYVAFEYAGKEFRSSTNAKPLRWSDVLASVTGETVAPCSEGPVVDGEPTKVGVGYYSFTLRLKEGYAWEDGLGADSAGDTKLKTYRWAVVADESVVTAAIDIHKSVSWSSVSNATVTVSTFTSPEMSGGKTPEVLFLGTLCNGHGMDNGAVTKSLKAVLGAANLRYYLVSASSSSASVKEGSLAKGQASAVDAISLSFNAPRHYALNKFYEILNEELITQGKTYDYIIFEFDGSRLADSYSTSPYEAAVSQKLLPYYQGSNVIWVVDNCYSSSGEPWNGADYWRPNTYYNNGSGNNLNATRYKGLVGMFDPENYNPNATSYSDLHYTDTKTVSRTTYYANTRYPVQSNYENADRLAEFIANAIKIKPYNLSLSDKIKHGDSGLTLDGVTIQVCTNGTDGTASTNPADWHDLMTWHFDTSSWEWLDTRHATGIPGGYMQVDAASNLVTAVISNVDFMVWTRVSMGIVDDGRFRTSEDAYYNQSTGKWEKNPNDGMAFAEMLDDLGQGLNIDGEAETEIPWSYDLFKIKAIVRNGEAFVAGRPFTEQGIGEHNNCTVYYRGWGGYQLKSVVVDGESVPIDTFQTHYTFADVTADHLVEIVYESFVTGAVSTPVTNVYDGVVHPYDVSVFFPTNEFGQAIAHPEVEVRFAPLDRIDDDSAWTNAAAFCEIYGTNVPQWVAGEYTDVGDHEFAYRVYAKQLGYGETISDEGWVWVKLDCMGSDHSVILPRPLTVRPNNSPLIYSTNDLPHIGFTLEGFVGDETPESIGAVDVTDGWYVTSTYRKGMGMGLYPTWVRDAENEELWNGRPDWLTPPAIDREAGLFNYGNYYLVTAKNGQPVEKLPLAIGGVDQVPGLDPESSLVDTGVDPAEKLYDGIPTNILVEVTSINPSNDTVMAEGVDYTIRYALADVADPSSPTTSWGETNPGRLHAGTNVVWYWVEPMGLMTNVYFATSNYQYVVVNPRKLVLESESATWKFNGAVHSLNSIHEIPSESDGLAPGDALTTNTTATILHVGTVANAFDWAITGTCIDGDYTVVTRTGTLEVTPRYMVIGGEDYDPTGRDDDPNLPGIYWHSGVEDAVKVYDGVGTNIIVRVDVPEDANRFKIYYTTNMTGTAEWSETNPVFTNVTDQAVWFRVEAVDAWARDYVAVTNFARVIITPRPATVTADEATTSVGATREPPYTATVTGDFPACDVGREYELIRWDAISTTNFADCVRAEGAYAGVIVPTGVATQGNYAVTFVPGTLVVTAKPVVYSLWITDHADAGDGKAHLAFCPTLSAGELTAEMVQAWGRDGALWVKCAPSEAELATASPQPIVELRNGTGTQDLKKGWVWITVRVPDGVDGDVDGAGRAWKILIDEQRE